MQRRTLLPIHLLLALLFCGTLRAAPPEEVAKKPASEKPDAAALAFYEKEVAPILESHCFKCHGGEKVRGGLRLNHRQSILRGGDSGPAASLKNPAESLLIQAVNYQGLEMPPSGKLPAEKIAVLKRWVEMGLPLKSLDNVSPPAEEEHGQPQVNEQTRNHWAFRPLERPKLPAVKNKSWSRKPLDQFILAQLEAEGLAPSPPADKVALLRRAYYNLIGLPPSPAEVQAFLVDDSPAALAGVVDRLLDSPQYGEKWGRHWLDLVRYAETNSYERDGIKPFAWRYRDYVIQSFNADKPYNEFIREQLAGDELEDSDREALIATGYYRLGIWDDEPTDPQQALYDDLDDVLAVTSQVFLGLTMNCARCHDHKLDPIPQRDYYRMLSFFSGLTRFGVRNYDSIAKNSLRTIALPEQQVLHAEAVAEHKRQVAENAGKLKKIEVQIRGDFSPVEVEEFKHERNQLALVKERVPKLLSEKDFAEYQQLFENRQRLRDLRPPALEMALCVTEVGRTPRDFHVLVRGNAHAPGEPVQPGFPSIFDLDEPSLPPAPEEVPSSGRRRVLAQWIASSENPLTARVMANRVWQYHFGRGIARSPNNFGLQGTPPTHPALLDHLASELISGGWRLKSLHRKIMLSQAWQMSSAASESALEKDPENDHLGRFDMRRLSAEEVRDSILAVNGSLNLEDMGGPSFYSKIPQAVLAGQSRPGDGWGNSSPRQRARRSVYIHVKRSLITPVLASFDAADTDSSCPVRFATTQPTQALGLLNSDLINEQAAVFADFLKKQVGEDPRRQVDLALNRVMQHPPTDEQVRRGVNLMRALQDEDNLTAHDALKYFCVVALNLNEFIYLD